MHTLRALLTENGRYSSRRTWERRLAGIPDTPPAQIGCFGQALVALIQPWAHCGRAAAIDSTVLRANGGVWHNQHREQGVAPHTSIDTEAHWTKSGWRGWIYGWKLHLASVVTAVWIPLAADLTPANVADNEMALGIIRKLPPELRFLLGDRHYNALMCCRRVMSGTTCWSPVGMAVIRIPTPAWKSGASFTSCGRWRIENFEHFKGIFDGHGQAPTQGVVNTRRFALGAVSVYQLALLYRFQHGLELNIGLKTFLKAA